MFIRLFLSVVAVSTLTSAAVLAGTASREDGAFLDPRYPSIQHPRLKALFEAERTVTPQALHSNVESVIAHQTAVKMQGSRGTCSIFASTALLESALVAHGDFDASLDLSEEWLEYVITRTRTSDGSTSNSNFRAFLTYGAPSEEAMPYIGETWENANDGLAADRCGKLQAPLLASCLVSHWDPRFLKASEAQLAGEPEFLKARQEAFAFRDRYLPKSTAVGGFYVSSEDEIKAELRRGNALTLGLDFFYGAWNHRVGPSLGIPRNMKHWERGIIGYPEPGSADRAYSSKDPAGHEIVVVGYDDSVEVTTESLMTDGTTRKFTYKGVYYFKNSWGTENFGKDFEINGVAHPGYGMITQKYAHELGGFYKFPLE